MNPTYREEACFFGCAGERLLGILVRPASAPTVGVLIVVGGPQYRVGSHRQFTLLARALGEAGVATFRFDYRGMGDSTGMRRSFEEIAPDIGAATDEFAARVPELRQVVLWGLCDAASAACEYAPSDRRIAGLVLANPWVRSEAGLAAAYLKHYYWRRLLERSFWRKVGRGELRLGSSLRALYGNVRRAVSRAQPSTAVGATDGTPARAPLADRMSTSLTSFGGPTLFILSGNDLTAAEFRDAAGRSAEWRAILGDRAVRVEELADADHTFSAAAWRARVERLTRDWVRERFGV